MDQKNECPTCGQKLPNSRTSAAVRDIWPTCVRVAASYGKEWRALSPSRQRLMEARLRDFPQSDPAILWQAIHGAMTYWRRQESERFHAGTHLVPETIYRPSQFTKYLESYEARISHVAAPAPRKVEPPVSEAERQAGQQRLQQLTSRLGQRMQVPR